MRDTAILALVAGLIALGACPASAGDYKEDAAKLDALAKRFDPRQTYAMPDACTAEYDQVSPNRKQVSRVRLNLKLVNGDTVENGAGMYTEQFGFSHLSFDCHRGGGQPNCTSGNYSFDTLPMKPGTEPEACKVFLSILATCQGVAGFKPSKRGCHMLDWEKELVEKGPAPKPKRVSPFGR